MKALIAVSIIIVLIIWLFADFHFGRKAHRAATKNISLPERQSDFELFTNGKALMKHLFHDFQKAKHFIHIQYYIVKNDKISEQFSNLLKKKAQQGVEVRLLLDRVGSSSFPVNVQDELKQSGVKFFYSSQPKLPFLFYSLQRRNHRKICVIDGEIGYVGGFNIGKEYIDGDHTLNPWHDYHLRLKGEGVQDLEHTFLEDWRQASGEEMHFEEVFLKPQPPGHSLQKFFVSDGAFLEEEYLELFKRAKEAITIATPYFIPTEKLLQQLLSCLQDGISVRVIVPLKTDHILIKEASYRYFRQLIVKGAEIYQYEKGFFHGKYILIDQAIADIGTANFDQRSLFLNKEINCYIFDNFFIQKVMKEVHSDIENSRPLSLDDLQNLGFGNRIKEWAAARIAYFL